MNIIAYFYWDPPRELFRIPFLDHPVYFYGAWFVLGFMVSYFIVIRLFTQKLQHDQPLTEQDIASWPTLLKGLQNETSIKFDPKLRQEINSLELGQEISASRKGAVLNALKAHPRALLEKKLPGAFVSCREWASFLTDRLTWFVILGTLIGARLGHVFFYEWPLYQDQPLEIFKIWKGGLASHGGVLGVMAGLWLYRQSIAAQFPTLTLIALFDLLVIPSGLVATCIRIGNFFNQEILGPETSMPWGVIFGHPMEGGAAVPRHATQLYEAIAYFAIFCLLGYLWKKRPALWPAGFLSGTFFILLFTARFLLEFVKESQQSLMIDESLLQTGQLLSVPFILLGFALYRYGPKLHRRALQRV